MAIELEYKRKIIGILQALFPGAKIYLFGSRARKEHTEFADIDLAIDAEGPLKRIDIDEANAMLLETNMPYKIDVVDYHRMTDEMKEWINKDKVLWKM